jgi:hypothetical protein
MVHDKWVLLCRKCGWKKEVPLLWADLRPKYCGNAKCKCSFLKEPEMLLSFEQDNAPVNEEVVTAVEEKAGKKGKQWR